MKRLALAGLLIWPLLLAQAQAQAERDCQDRLREFRVYADVVTRARTTQEVEASRSIADLLKQIEALQGEVQRLREKK